MISRVNKLLVAFFLIAVTSYIFYLNPEPIAVHIGRGEVWSAPLAVVLLTVFAIGVLLTALVSLFFGMKAYFRERGFANREQKWQLIRERMLDARGLTAAEEWEEAKVRWQEILKRDPANTLARVELSRALERSGEIAEAQRVLDDARASGDAQIEVLLRAAELALSQGNRTAALDNCALALKRHPSLRAARLARGLALELNRFDEALEYHRQYARMGGADLSIAEVECARILARSKPEELTARLREFVRQESYAPALEALAERELAEGRREDAAKALFRAAEIAHSPDLALRAAEIFIAAHLPDRAVSTLKAFVHRLEGVTKLRGEMAYARLTIQLQMLTEAQRSLDAIGEQLPLAPADRANELIRQADILRGLFAATNGDSPRAMYFWKRLAGISVPEAQDLPAHRNGHTAQTPNPTLSTP